jgi:hypothetical protein
MSPRPSRSTAARASSVTLSRKQQQSRIFFFAFGAGSLVMFVLDFLRVYHGATPPM